MRLLKYDTTKPVFSLLLYGFIRTTLGKLFCAFTRHWRGTLYQFPILYDQMYWKTVQVFFIVKLDMILLVVFVRTIFSIDFSGIISTQTLFYPKTTSIILFAAKIFSCTTKCMWQCQCSVCMRWKEYIFASAANERIFPCLQWLMQTKIKTKNMLEGMKLNWKFKVTHSLLTATTTDD